MSTRAIRELITLTRPWREEAAKKALIEVEAIERAAKDLGADTSNLDPAIRRPALARYSAAVDLFESIAKDAP